jgi:23S rRNA (uridine2552-2'-O)-methyltransferase
MANTKGSKSWLRAHRTDFYVKKARKEGFRSRAAYKLLDLHKKHRLFIPNQTILDLGAAPGAWSQLAVQLVGQKGRVFAVDILSMSPLNNVSFIQGDLTQEATIAQLRQLITQSSIDLVMSDMAPNLSGLSSIDQPRMLHLLEAALDITVEFLKPKASFLIKCFQGVGFEAYLKTLKELFGQVVIRKPLASRARSAELYLLARSYRGKNLSSQNL